MAAAAVLSTLVVEHQLTASGIEARKTFSRVFCSGLKRGKAKEWEGTPNSKHLALLVSRNRHCGGRDV